MELGVWTDYRLPWQLVQRVLVRFSCAHSTSANNKMLEEQKRDKEDIDAKQKETMKQSTLLLPTNRIRWSAQALTTKAVSWRLHNLNLAGVNCRKWKECFTCRKRQQKAATEAAAAETTLFLSEEQRKAVEASANTNLQAQVQAATQTPVAETCNLKQLAAAPFPVQFLHQQQLIVNIQHVTWSSYPMVLRGVKKAPWVAIAGVWARWAASAATAGFRVR